MLTKNKDIFKAIPVDKLRRLLRKLPGDYFISVSLVNDLLVLDNEEVPAGFISLSEEKTEMFEVQA